jgi:hypothetical protein
MYKTVDSGTDKMSYLPEYKMVSSPYSSPEKLVVAL